MIVVGNYRSLLSHTVDVYQAENYSHWAAVRYWSVAPVIACQTGVVHTSVRSLVSAMTGTQSAYICNK